MTRSVRLAVLTSAAAMAVFVGATEVRAGSYPVTACKAAPGNLNFAWKYVETGPPGKLLHDDGCAGMGEFGGLWVVDRFNDGSVGNSSGDVSGFWRFDAPATTAITGLSYSRYLRTYDDQRWRSEARKADNTPLESCQVPLDDPFCTLGANGGSTTSFGMNTSRVEVGVRCASGSPMMFCSNGFSIHSAQATLYGATVTISDPQPPAAGALTGTLFAGGWLRGLKSAAMTGSDATGVQSLDLRRDGGTSVKTTSFSCDNRLAAPCTVSGSTSASSAWSDVDTATLADGVHTFAGVAKDAAGNTQPTSAEVQVDNTPPVAPVGLSAGTSTWGRQAGRTVSWSAPGGQAAPITGAQVTVCKGGSECFTPAASTTGSTFALPSEGAWVASVKLVDAAGNVGAIGTVPIGFDTGAPPAPLLGAVQATGGTSYRVPVDTGNDPGPAPITGLTGEACPDDGGADCSTVMGSGNPLTGGTVVLPRAGRWTIGVRVIDAAGNTGATAMTTYTVTDTAAPEPTLTPTPTQTATPSPTATPTARRRPQLRLTRARLTKRLVDIRGVLSRPATGKVKVRLRARRRTVTRSVAVRNGTFAVKLRLKRKQRGTAGARVRVRYGGDGNYTARGKTVSLKR